MLGPLGELLVCRLLEAQGHTLLAINYRSPYGEIDILSRHQTTLVATEVKTRSSPVYGQGEESLTPTKLTHIRHTLSHFLDNFPCSFTHIRIDAYCLVIQKQTLIHYTYYEGIG